VAINHLANDLAGLGYNFLGANFHHLVIFLKKN
jgi:hypothetical protein